LTVTVFGAATALADHNVICESVNGAKMECLVGHNYGVSIVAQLSANPCIEGQTWGHHDDRIWVVGGCRAEFRIREMPRSERVICRSIHGNLGICKVSGPVIGVELRQQISHNPCLFDQTYGFDKAGGKTEIWVTGGCGGEFEVFFR
jgi:hypothetical protein